MQNVVLFKPIGSSNLVFCVTHPFEFHLLLLQFLHTVADKIVASPFAVLGSIGVISELPNVYDRLKKEGIEFQTVTAGKYKRTLTPTKKVTKEDFEKSKQDVEEILVLFRDFVAQNRPQLDIDTVATGETWFGTAALERKLCDEIKTVDDVLMEYVDNGSNVYEVKYQPPVENPLERFGLATAESATNTEDSSSWLRRVVRWTVQTIASELRSEMESSISKNIPIEQQYMAKDDTSSRTKVD
jgi:ClpP class serine protease